NTPGAKVLSIGKLRSAAIALSLLGFCPQKMVPSSPPYETAFVAICGSEDVDNIVCVIGRTSSNFIFHGLFVGSIHGKPSSAFDEICSCLLIPKRFLKIEHISC